MHVVHLHQVQETKVAVCPSEAALAAATPGCLPMPNVYGELLMTAVPPGNLSANPLPRSRSLVQMDALRAYGQSAARANASSSLIEGDDGDDRSEDLLLNHLHVLPYVHKYRRLIEVTGQSRMATTTCDAPDPSPGSPSIRPSRPRATPVR